MPIQHEDTAVETVTLGQFKGRPSLNLTHSLRNGENLCIQVEDSAVAIVSARQLIHAALALVPDAADIRADISSRPRGYGPL